MAQIRLAGVSPKIAPLCHLSIKRKESLAPEMLKAPLRVSWPLRELGGSAAKASDPRGMADEHGPVQRIMKTKALIAVLGIGLGLKLEDPK